jgi:hypothetical protein
MLGKLTIYCCALVPVATSMFLGGGNRQVAADEAYVARVYGNCAAFTPSPHHCSFAVAATPDRAGGRLYAVELRYQTGDDCYAGIVYFFDGTRYSTRTRDLPPYSIGGVTEVRADGTGRFTVVYLVNKNKSTSCAAGGDAGTNTYIYRWTGSRMVRQSGALPRLPEVILGTGVNGRWPVLRPLPAPGALRTTARLVPGPDRGRCALHRARCGWALANPST